jgi:hypothetical protein
MKFLTFDQIKAQLRLDDQQAFDEHDILVLYGEAAEEAVLTIMRRSLLDVILTYNGIPQRLIQVTLLLVDEWYQHRSSVEQGQLSSVPYAFDFMLKPMMRLSGDEPLPDDESSLPQGAIVSSDGRVLVDKDYRIVCSKPVNNL